MPAIDTFDVKTVRQFGVSAVAVDENRFVVVGGQNGGEYLSTVELCDIRSKKWETLPDLLYPVSSCSVVHVQGTIYVIGGRRNGQESAISEIAALDLRKNKWTQLPNMKYKRRGLAAVAMGNFIYVFGGLGIGGKGDSFLDTVERYDISNQKWEDQLSMDVPRGWCSAAALNGEIYVIGGNGDPRDLKQTHRSGQVFDATAEIWSELPRQMHVARSHFVALTLGQYIVAVGGQNDQNSRLTSAEIYSVQRERWLGLEEDAMSPRAGFAAAMLGKGKLVVVGGDSGTQNNEASNAELILGTYLQSFLPTEVHMTARSALMLGDHTSGPDLLDVEAEAFALADTIAFHNLEPPFTVGLFGGWGAGKSFTFEMMLRRWQEIQKEDLTRNSYREQFPFAGHLYFVKFDAWTFAKGSLWSSLMLKVLDSLNEQLHLESLLRTIGGRSLLLKGYSLVEIMQDLSRDERGYLHERAKEANKESLMSDFKFKNGEISKALVEAVNACHEQDQEKLKTARHEYGKEFSRIRRKTAWMELEKRLGARFSSEVEVLLNHYRKKERNGKAKPESLYERLLFRRNIRRKPESDSSPNIGEATDADASTGENEIDEEYPDSIEDLIDDLSSLGEFLVAFRSTKLSPFAWAFFIASTVVSGMIIAIVTYSFAGEIAERIFEVVVSSVVSLVLPIVTFVAQKTRTFRKMVSPLKHLFKEAQHLDVDTENGESHADSEKLLSLKKDIAILEERAWLVQGKSLDSVVKERVDSKVYEKDLGVVHQAQIDLQHLSDALTSKKSTEIFPRGTPRIALFVDDMDRIPPEKAVEMLEAVQLLVKTNLFVVVMAIDTRFISLSLEKVYSNILRPDSRPTGLDYLEKIIQLPYRVPTLNRNEAMHSYLKGQMRVFSGEGREEKVTSTQKGMVTLSDDKEETEVTDEDVTATGSGEDPVKLSQMRQNDTGQKKGIPLLSDSDLDTDNDEDAQAMPGFYAFPPGPGSFRETQRYQSIYYTPANELPFSSTEIENLKQACLVSRVSPRSAKRLVNVFKILKRIWYDREHKGYGPRTEEKNACLVLLALSATELGPMRQGMSEVFYTLEHRRAKLMERFRMVSGAIIFIIGLERITDGAVELINETFSKVDWGSYDEWFWLARSFSFVGASREPPPTIEALSRESPTFLHGTDRDSFKSLF